MFDFLQVDESCIRVHAQATTSRQEISTLVHLNNGVTADEFLDEFKEMINSDNQLIAMDSEDIVNVLAEKENAFYGRFFFRSAGDKFNTEDDMSWLQKAGTLDACIFITGTISITATMDIVERIRSYISEDSNVIFSLADKDSDVVQVNILSA